MLRLVSVIAIVGGSLLGFSFFKLISTTIELYRKPKDEIKREGAADEKGAEDKYKKQP